MLFGKKSQSNDQPNFEFFMSSDQNLVIIAYASKGVPTVNLFSFYEGTRQVAELEAEGKVGVEISEEKAIARYDQAEANGRIFDNRK